MAKKIIRNDSKKTNAIAARPGNRFDGWSNIFTNLGVDGKDKRTGASIAAFRMLQVQAEEFYEGDDVAARIVDRLPEEMTREGFKICCEDFPDITEEVQDIFERYGLDQKIEQGLKWARLYGGAGIIFGLKDGKAPDNPVNFKSLQAIEYATILDMYQLIPFTTTSIDKDLDSLNFGKPKFYKLQDDGTIKQSIVDTLKIHHSRVVRFEGIEVPKRNKAQVNWWGSSMLGRLYNPILNYQSANDSAALIMQDVTQLIVKLKNLSEMIAQGDDSLVTKRLALLAKTASIINAVIVEEGEDVERKTTQLTGIPELLTKIGSRLVAATDYPHTILLGESPSGLGATGDSEKKDFYSFVKNQQESILRPILKQILKFIFAAKDGPTGGVIPEKYTIEFTPLWMPTEKETVETRKIQAETDDIYISNGTLDPDEVAESRWGGGQYSIETTVDFKAREQLNREPQGQQSENYTGGGQTSSQT